MMNESINFNCRRRPGQLGNGQPVKIEKGIYVHCDLSECTHVLCKCCGHIFRCNQWFSFYECQKCGS